MEVITRVIEREESKTAKAQKPVIISWKNSKLLRSQSINACVNDIYETSQSMFFLKVNLIGASGSGKTVLGSVLAHQLHERDPTFEVHKLTDEDLIDFKSTIQKLSRSNQILVFDDLSGLVAKFGKTALDNLKSELTTIRHIDDQESRKIIMILSFHAQKILDKFIRISNFTFYTDCQLEEIAYLEELLGKQHSRTIHQFAKLRAQSRMYHKFQFSLSRGNYFSYKDGDPFRVVLYNNGLTTRFIVSPQLSWILEGKICQICDPSNNTDEAKKNLDDFVNDFSKKFTKGVAKRAVELRLLRHGIQTQPKRVMQAERYIDIFFDAKKIPLDELAMRYGLKKNTTKIFPNKKPEGVLIDKIEISNEIS